MRPKLPVSVACKCSEPFFAAGTLPVMSLVLSAYADLHPAENVGRALTDVTSWHFTMLLSKDDDRLKYG